MKKERFQQCLDDMLGSYNRWPKDLPNNGEPSADGYYHLRLYGCAQCSRTDVSGS